MPQTPSLSDELIAKRLKKAQYQATRRKEIADKQAEKEANLNILQTHHKDLTAEYNRLNDEYDDFREKTNSEIIQLKKQIMNLEAENLSIKLQKQILQN